MEHLDFLVKCLEKNKIDELFEYLCNVDTKGLDVLYYFLELIRQGYSDNVISKEILEKSICIYQAHNMPVDY